MIRKEHCASMRPQSAEEEEKEEETAGGEEEEETDGGEGVGDWTHSMVRFVTAT